MDYNILVPKILPGADFNPACFNFSEAEAREKLLWRDARPMPSQAQLEFAQVDLNKDLAVDAAYDKLVKDVYKDMEETLGSKSDASVTADIQTYQLMLQFPAEFLTAQLDTEAKVSAHALAQLAPFISYVKKRQARLATFRATRAQVRGQ